jgi:hypothetical protein
MAIAYTARYSNDDDQIIRWIVMHCQDKQDAVRTAAAKMLSPYAALEISLGDKVVWQGSRDRVNIWASSTRAKGAPCYTAHLS